MSPLLSAQNLSRVFGSKILFEKITLSLAEKERAALIGPNGSGKSTLLKMFAALEDSDSGVVTWRKGASVAYVEQTDRVPPDTSIAQILRDAAHESTTDERQVESRVARAVALAGFENPEEVADKLSGGWKKKLSILRALVKEPDLLLLDEPTNHLDLESILWLEELIANLPCAVLFISHDRYFIERLAARVIELDQRYPLGFLEVKGDYADFLQARQDYLSQLQSTLESLENKVRREVEWLRAGVKARTTKQKARIKSAHNLIGELDSFARGPETARFEFAKSERKSHDLILVEDISKSLGGKTLFQKISFALKPGIRLGVVGRNGSGKSTLLNILRGDLKSDSGKVARALGLRIASLSQQRAFTTRETTLRKALCPEGDQVVFNGKQLHVSAWARRFLFKTEQLSQPVSSLSGGEQARALLAQLMCVPAEVLMLDEPTNDLDISTLEVLEESLTEFAGAVVLVSHDRYLLDRVCTGVLGIGEEEQPLFANYTQWELYRAERAESVNGAGERREREATHSRGEKKKKLTYAEQKEWDSMEKRIEKAEKQVLKLDNELHNPAHASNAPHLIQLQGELTAARSEVEKLFSRWQELEEKLKEYEPFSD